MSDTQHTYRPGTASEKARKSRGQLTRLATVVAGVAWTIPFALFIEGFGAEGFQWDPILIGTIIALGLLVLWARLAHVERNRSSQNGSFYYVAALEEGTRDRRAPRFENAVLPSDPASRSPFFVQEVNRPLAPSTTGSWAGSLNSLLRDLDYSAGEDDRNNPANILVNVAWPIGIGLGLRLVLEGAKATSSAKTPLDATILGSALRIWYQLDGQFRTEDWFEELRGRAVGGDLVDVIDQTALPHRPEGILVEETTEGSASGVPRSTIDALTLAPVAGSGSKGPYRLVRGSNPCAISLELSGVLETTSSAHRLTLEEPTLRPADFGQATTVAAAVILGALERSRTAEPGESSIVTLYARLPLPVAIGIGVQLRKWLPNPKEDVPYVLDRLQFMVWNSGTGAHHPISLAGVKR